MTLIGEKDFWWTLIKRRSIYFDLYEWNLANNRFDHYQKISWWMIHVYLFECGITDSTEEKERYCSSRRQYWRKSFHLLSFISLLIDVSLHFLLLLRYRFDSMKLRHLTRDTAFFIYNWRESLCFTHSIDSLWSLAQRTIEYYLYWWNVQLTFYNSIEKYFSNVNWCQ